ncbi:MAG: hypothetical protein Q9207_001982 [Kuettlingeria erythrocarpa]
MLARDTYTAKQIWWVMVNVFFGSSYLGFLMLSFIILTNILLLTSLIAILSQSLTKVGRFPAISHVATASWPGENACACGRRGTRYSVFVLEASASRRLTYYFPPLVRDSPVLSYGILDYRRAGLGKLVERADLAWAGSTPFPAASLDGEDAERIHDVKLGLRFGALMTDPSASEYPKVYRENLIPLILFRPLRLCIPSEQLRNARIMVLRATHIPYVAAIWLYESTVGHWRDRKEQWLHQTGSRKRSILADHLNSARKATKYPAIKNRSEASLMVKTPGDTSEGRSYFAKDLDAAAELKRVLDKLNAQGEMIEKLSTQVETLTRPHSPSPRAKADS